jgi:hypothetical protein
MRTIGKIAAALFLAVLGVPLSATAATIGGTYYAPQYDFRDFWVAADGKNFRVVLAGNPFPTIAGDDVARRLLPVMQDAKPRPALTFTYEKPAQEPHPDYRLVLVFDYANDLGGDQVCQGITRFKPLAAPGLFKLFAVYCRNDMVMSMTTAWTPASGPEDPRVNQLFRELFLVVFSDSQAIRPHIGPRRF